MKLPLVDIDSVPHNVLFIFKRLHTLFPKINL